MLHGVHRQLRCNEHPKIWNNTCSGAALPEEEFVTSHHTPVEGRENTEPVWSPSATRFSAPTSHYYHRRRQVSSGLGIFRLSAARKFDPTRNRTPASWMANERHTTTLTHVFNVPPDKEGRRRGLLQGWASYRPRARHLPLFQLTYHENPIASHKIQPK